MVAALGYIEILDILRVLITLALLAFCSYSDIRWRKVTNKVWIPFVIIGLIFAVVEFSISFDLARLIWYILSFVIVFFISYFIFAIGGFGGADAKLFIFLSVLFTHYPVFGKYPLMPLNPVLAISPNTGALAVAPSIGIYPLTIFPLSVLVNTFILSLAVPISILIYNLIKLPKDQRSDKGYYMFMCLRINKDKIDEVKMRVMDEDDDYAWISPKIPLMIFITIGFIIALIYGDLIYGIISLLI